MTSSQLVPALIVPLVLWRVYARVRRNIGRQLFRPRRLKFGAILLGVITTLLAAGAFRSPPAVGGLAGGLAIGAALGWFGLRLTRFETSLGETFYTPNATLGVGVTLIFIGRIVYRLTQIAGPHDPAARVASLQNPLTLAVFGLTAGYYIYYYIGVLVRGQAVAKKTS